MIVESSLYCCTNLLFDSTLLQRQSPNVETTVASRHPTLRNVLLLSTYLYVRAQSQVVRQVACRLVARLTRVTVRVGLRGALAQGVVPRAKTIQHTSSILAIGRSRKMMAIPSVRRGIWKTFCGMSVLIEQQ